jgi:hypothetical protein
MAMKQEGEMYALLARQSINKRYFHLFKVKYLEWLD